MSPPAPSFFRPRYLFLGRLIASRLLSVSEIDNVLSALSLDECDDEEALARRLIETKRLTRWQVAKLWVGRTSGFFVGQYKLLSFLGEGGMGKVYVAEHTFMRRHVALKVVPPTKVKDDQVRRRFLREVSAAAALAHPNIVTAFDAGQDEKVAYLAMELIDGLDLARRVKLHGPIEEHEAADIIGQVAEALAYAHRRGIVHRDIKPQNVMVNRDGAAKLLDLGVARFLADEPDQKRRAQCVDNIASSMTIDGAVCGTLAYVAPEQARDARCADQRSDVYSLGCTLYYLLTGVQAFRGASAKEIVLQKVVDGPEPIRAYAPRVAPELETVTLRMMAMRPQDRLQSMDEVVAALAPYRRRATTAPGRPDDPGMEWSAWFRMVEGSAGETDSTSNPKSSSDGPASTQSEDSSAGPRGPRSGG